MASSLLSISITSIFFFIYSISDLVIPISSSLFIITTVGFVAVKPSLLSAVFRLKPPKKTKITVNNIIGPLHLFSIFRYVLNTVIFLPP